MAKKIAGRSNYHPPQGGFKRADSALPKRLILSLDGLEKQGKNHFAFTAPGPIATISLDIGTEGVVQKFQKAKEIWVADYQMPVGLTGRKKNKPTAEEMAQLSELYSDSWSKLCGDYREALDAGFRTVVVDTGSELWEMLRIARFGKLTQVMPHHYGPVNAEYREFIRAAYECTTEKGHAMDVNLILLHKLKDEWKNGADGKGVRTGEYKRAGMNDTGFLVQVNAVCWRDEEEKKIPECFHCTVQDCRANAALAGEDLAGDMCNFPTLAALATGYDVEEFQ